MWLSVLLTIELRCAAWLCIAALVSNCGRIFSLFLLNLDYRRPESVDSFHIRKRKSQSTANMNNIDGVIDETKPLR